VPAVCRWRSCFAETGLAGLRDRPRSGKPRRSDDAFRQRVLSALEQPPPAGQSTWDGPALAAHLGVNVHAVWRLLCREGNWEAAKMIPLHRAQLSSGWHKLDAQTDPRAKAFGNRLPEVWKATQPGESIAFRFRGTVVRIYDLVGPDAGQVAISLDDQPSVVKPRFDAYCTYHRLASLSVGEGLPDAVHTVKLTIHPEQPDKARILNQRGEKMDDPKRFDGTAWYAGAVLLVGEWVE